MNTAKSKLEIVPISQAEAFAFIAKHHRHHQPPRGAILHTAVFDSSRHELRDLYDGQDGRIVGVAIAGRPVSRVLAADGMTLEVTRCCTDGTRNASSMLYRALWRAARALGYRKLITYTLASEGGASLRGAGFKLIGAAGGGTWHTPSRPRVDTHPTQEKLRWELLT